MCMVVIWDIDYNYAVGDTKRSDIIRALISAKDIFHYRTKMLKIINLGKARGYFEPLPGESDIYYPRANGMTIKARIGDGSYNDYWARMCYAVMLRYVKECPAMKTVRFNPIIQV